MREMKDPLARALRCDFATELDVRGALRGGSMPKKTDDFVARAWEVFGAVRVDRMARGWQDPLWELTISGPVVSDEILDRLLAEGGGL
jgi:hypothetical protein